MATHISSVCITKVPVDIRARGNWRLRTAVVERTYGSERIRVTLPTGPKTDRSITLDFDAAAFVAAVKRMVADG